MSGFMPLMGSVRLVQQASPLIAQNQAPGWNGGARFPFMGQAPVQPVAPVAPTPVSPPQQQQPVVQPVLTPAPIVAAPGPVVVTPSFWPLAIGLGALALVTVIAVTAGNK